MNFKSNLAQKIFFFSTRPPQFFSKVGGVPFSSFFFVVGGSTAKPLSPHADCKFWEPKKDASRILDPGAQRQNFGTATSSHQFLATSQWGTQHFYPQRTGAPLKKNASRVFRIKTMVARPGNGETLLYGAKNFFRAIVNIRPPMGPYKFWKTGLQRPNFAYWYKPIIVF